MDKYSPQGMLAYYLQSRACTNPEQVAVHCVALAHMIQRLLDRKTLTDAQELSLGRRSSQLADLLRPYGLQLKGGWGTTLVATDGPISLRLTGK